MFSVQPSIRVSVQKKENGEEQFGSLHEVMKKEKGIAHQHRTNNSARWI